ncbi:hypothetical protein SAMN02745177_02682 [Desulforamulus hydrothermalis Lam5 = DSM 18033]|nr:hypothetical protein SAMN02745177_02682 [Desulforamulus hydrothermalis Lam5 = DSM 18033]
MSLSVFPVSFFTLDEVVVCHSLIFSMTFDLTCCASIIYCLVFKDRPASRPEFHLTISPALLQAEVFGNSLTRLISGGILSYHFCRPAASGIFYLFNLFADKHRKRFLCYHNIFQRSSIKIKSVDKHHRWFIIPFGSGLRTDSTMIRYGRPWGRHPNGPFRSSSAVTGASTSRRHGVMKPPHFVLQPLSTV